jgi:hypothetical protein
MVDCDLDGIKLQSLAVGVADTPMANTAVRLYFAQSVMMWVPLIVLVWGESDRLTCKVNRSLSPGVVLAHPRKLPDVGHIGNDG